MPPIFRFYLRHVAIGFAAAALFVALLLWTDALGLRSLILRSPDGMLALTLLLVFNGLVFNGLVFGGAQAAMAVFLMAERDDPPSGPPIRWVEAPSRVPAVERRRESRPQRPSGTTVP